MELSVPCKVCNRGSLSQKRIHRMSGPAVMIGYILLIPSNIGILLSGLGVASLLFPSHARLDARGQAAAEMRAHGVSGAVIKRVLTDPKYVPQKDLESGEGAEWVVGAQNRILTANRETAPAATIRKSDSNAVLLMQRYDIPGSIIRKVVENPTSDPVDDMEYLSMYQLSWVHEAQGQMRTAVYFSPEADTGVAVGRALGQGFFLLTAIASFVGGLLGWLLVLKNRVLQYAFCDAVVSAS